MDSEAKILKFPPAEGVTPSSESGNSQPRAASTSTSVAPPSSPPPPVWVQRFFLITTVIFCLWIGLVLSVLPWLPPWTENTIVNDFPNLRWFLGTGFVRGLVTGLGLLDLWIGISEAVHYRDRR